MSTGAKSENQHPTDQYTGGNTATYDKNKLYQPPAFLGKSGQSDNASTNRPKGQAGS